jgi:hypothetical protein
MYDWAECAIEKTITIQTYQPTLYIHYNVYFMTRGTHITVTVSHLVQFSKLQHRLMNAISYNVALHNSLGRLLRERL